MSYAKLRGRIVEVFGTQEAFAKAMGFTTSAISMRLNNKIKWNVEEVFKAKELLKIEDSEVVSYFFTPKVHIN